MEIHHKVKPLHGWREFIGEVGIIVLGVLIALGGEQIAEQWHWHHLTHLGREAMGADLADTYALATERELFSRCLSGRLTEISLILDKASRDGRLPPVGQLGNPPKRSMLPASWDGLVASQTAIHFPREEANAYANLARYAATLDRENEKEFENWSELYTIVGPGRSYSPTEDAMLRQALSAASYNAKLMRLGAYQLKQRIRTAHLSMDAQELHDNLDFIAESRRRMSRNGICRPIGPAPVHYGASPMNYALDGPVGG